MKVKHFAAWDMTAGFCLLYRLLVDVETERGVLEGKGRKKRYKEKNSMWRLLVN